MSFTPLLSRDWLRASTGCQPPPLREPGRSGGGEKTQKGGKKINFKLTCPTGCQSHFGDTEGCPSWQDLTSRGREVTNSITGRGQRRGLGGLTCSRGWLTCSRIEPIYLSTPPWVPRGNLKAKGRGGEVKKVVTGKRDGSTARGGEKKGKKVAEFRGVNDELLFIKWRETYSGTIQKTEQGDSDLVLQSSQYLHSRRQPWNYTENGIVMSGPLKILVYSHYGAGKSLHPHIIPRKRREAGCVSAGTAAGNERVGVSLMKRTFPCFSLRNILRALPRVF